MERIPEEWRYFDTTLNIPYPWYTKPCLEWLDNMDLKGKWIFEYGVGDSTYWYHVKGAYVRGVDSNYDWAKRFGSECVILKDEYVFATPVGRMFDIICIDGDFRDECTQHALGKLKTGGYLIIDNYKQKSADLEHWPLTDELIKGLPITIYKEPGHEDWQTAVITKL